MHILDKLIKHVRYSWNSEGHTVRSVDYEKADEIACSVGFETERAEKEKSLSEHSGKQGEGHR